MLNFIRYAIFTLYVLSKCEVVRGMDKKTLKKRIDEIASFRYYEPEKVIKICRQLISQGKKEKDDAACAYGEYYLAEARYRLGFLNEETVKKAIRIMQLARRANLPEIECRCYNLLGVSLLNQGDVVAAAEYYQKGLAIARKYRYTALCRVFVNNMGDLYLRINDYPKALACLKKSYQQSIAKVQRLKTTRNSTTHIYNLNVSVLNIAEVYYLMKDYEESLHYIGLMRAEESLNGKFFYSSMMNALYAMNYGRLGRVEECKKYTQKVIEDARAGYEKIESVSNYLEVCRMLLDRKDYDSAKTLLCLIRGLVEERAYAGLWCEYYEVLIQYQNVCAKEQLLTSYEAYFKYKKQQEHSMALQQQRAMKTRQVLNDAVRQQEQMELRNIQLKNISEHDALTGLYNRYALNRECEKWICEARNSKTTIGIIVLDVDCFKQYNDAYGHLAGDKCLKSVSEALREAVKQDEMLVRYGGDEFFVLVRNKTDEEMVECAQNIKLSVGRKKIVHEASFVSDYVTVSQGVANGILEEEQSFFDVVHFADNALYRAKEFKRGSIGVYGSDNKYHIFENKKPSEAK